jgi:hypothetical protein
MALRDLSTERAYRGLHAAEWRLLGRMAIVVIESDQTDNSTSTRMGRARNHRTPRARRSCVGSAPPPSSGHLSHR